MEIKSKWSPLAVYLRTHEKLRMKDGGEMGRRIQYFKAGRLLNLLVSDPEASRLSPQPCRTRAEAQQIAQRLEQDGFLHRSLLIERHRLEPIGFGLQGEKERPKWEEDTLLVWDVEAPTGWGTVIAGVGVIVVALVACMHSIWPDWLRQAVGYVSMVLLIAIIALIPIRYLINLYYRRFAQLDVWLFPNLFMDGPSVIDAFKPTWSSKPVGQEAAPAKKQPKVTKHAAKTPAVDAAPVESDVSPEASS